MSTRPPLAPRLLAAAIWGGLLVSAGSARGQTQETFKLLPGDGAPADRFGCSTAIRDGVVVVGARGDEDNGPLSGSAYLFDAPTGAQLVKLLPSDGAAGDEFGSSVAIAGGLVVVGAPRDDDNGTDSGSAYLFDASTGAGFIKLLPADGAPGDQFGCAVAMAGGVVAVGAKRDDDNGSDSGSVYLFDAFSGIPLAKLLPNDGAADDTFGEVVDLDGETVVVGAHGDDDNGPLSGSAYLFDVSTGSQLNKLLPLDGGTNDFFGAAVAIDGGVVVVGAWADSVFFDHSGSAYLFDRASGSQIVKIVPSDGHDRDHFGYSVAIDAGVVAIGAEQDGDNGFDAGSAYLFDASDGSPVTKILASDGDAFDGFGTAVTIENGVVAVGAPGDDDNGGSSGSAYVIDPRGAGTGTPFCLGDGTGAACPCGNVGAAGHGCGNSVLAGSRLAAGGIASVSNDTVAFHVTGSTPSQPGLLFQGDSALSGGQGVPFGDGLRCAGGGVVRLEVLFPDPQGVADSSVTVSAAGGASVGQTLRYQWWYRDSGSSPCSAEFNLSNGYELAWAP